MANLAMFSWIVKHLDSTVLTMRMVTASQNLGDLHMLFVGRLNLLETIT